MPNLLSAVLFAAQKHSNQRRKDKAASPYINHPIAVAELMQRVGGITDPIALIAALLHDTVEDTDTSPEELKEKFGEGVCDLVMEVTDNKSLPKAERKRLQIVNTPHKSALAKTIKLADKICNISDLTPENPVGWPLERKLDYLDWAEKVIAGCRGINPALEALFDARVAERRKAL